MSGARTAFVVSGSLSTIGGGGYSPWLLACELAQMGYDVTAYTCHCHDLPAQSDWPARLQVRMPLLNRGWRWALPDRALILRVVLDALHRPPQQIFNVGVTLHTRLLMRSPIAGRITVWENIDADPELPLIDAKAAALLKRCRRMLSPAPRVDACIRSGYGYRGEIRRIPFWIDPAPPQGEAGSILPADFLFLARKDRYKGFELAFDAIAALTESEGVRATIRVAGPGSDDWLRKRAAAYGLGEQLHIDFFRTRQAVMDALASARCLLLPSAHEGYPLVLLEALSQGTPVIATDTGGVADMLGETVGTLVIPKDEPDALVDAVRQMYLAVRRGVPSEYRDALKARFAAINSRETIARHLSRVLT